MYAVIVMTTYTWSLVQFFWRIPSWLYFSTLGDIWIFFSYMISVNVLESVLLLVLPILLAFILPKRWFHDQFTVKGSLLILLGLGYMMFFHGNLIAGFLSPWVLLPKVLIAGSAILGLTFLIARIVFLEKFVLELSNRLVVFLYLWMPISALALVTVLIRNIF
ncbi:MAG: hypothetical protein Q8L87_02515 [Anaerolineales bacterium]|nr:hypothetical protein [Anaerolineales bacterium]